MDIQTIVSILPHRYPFLLVDKVLDIIPGQKITAIKNVTFNEYFFTGHFPQEPVMPGVLLLEALAQAGALAVLSMEEYKNKTAFLGGVNKAKFRRKVIPGDILRLEVEIVKLKTNAGIGQGAAYVDDKKCAEGELTFIIG